MDFNHLLWKEPWLAPVALHIENVIKTKSIKTMGITTDGKALYYNPKFWKSKTSEEKLGLQIHELLHIVNLHELRRNGRKEDLWNLACDMEINDQIRRAGYCLPKDLAPPIHSHAEAIYDMLVQLNVKCAKNRKPSVFIIEDEELNGEVLKQQYDLSKDMLKGMRKGMLKSFTEGGSKEIDAELLDLVDTASNLCGTGTTKFSAIFKPSVSVVNWQMVLQNLVKSVVGGEVDYLSYEFDEFGVCEDVLSQKPNARICVLVDESGSIEDALYEQFLAELKNMERFADIKISGFSDNTKLHLLPLRKYHRTMTGGTCVLNAYSEAITKDFDCIIILTDGYLYFPEKEPIETIWAMPESQGRKKEVILK